MILRQLQSISSDRVRLELEDGTELVTFLSVLADLRLHAEQDLTETDMELLLQKTALAEAKEYALSMLGRRMYSRKELSDRFSRRGTPPFTAAEALDWLESLGYLDDTQYAQAIIRHYSAKGYGASRIRSELYKRGIPRPIQDEVLISVPDSSHTIDRLLHARLRDPENRDDVRKAGNYLFRRGFSWEEIRAALERYHETL